MTAHGDPAAEKRLWDMGIAQYLEKPLELGEIISEILSAEKKYRPSSACALALPDAP
jgi:DNA-binding response OmpR family regulator